MEYKQFSPEQLDRAKNADIISFLTAYMGFDFKQSGHYYQCKQHNSLVIYSDRNGKDKQDQPCAAVPMWHLKHFQDGTKKSKSCISGLTMTKQDGRQSQTTQKNIGQKGTKYIQFSAKEKMSTKI